MPYPLQFLDYSTANYSTAATCPLTVGENFQPGDLRIVKVWLVNAASSATSFPGFTKTYDSGNITSYGHFFYFTQVLTASSVDSTLTFNAAGVITVSAVTVRNPNLGSLSVVPTAVDTSGTSAASSSVTVAANDVVIFYWDFNNASAITLTGPAGLTPLAQSDSDTSVSLFAAKTFTTAGSSGTFTTTSTSVSTSAIRTEAIVLHINPDVTSAITASAETDAGVAVTSALLTTTTNAITPAQEVDTTLEIYNPLRAVSIRPPVLLTGSPVSASRVTWQASTPAAGSAVLVETSLDSGASWQTALNGGAVPGLARGDTTTPVVLTRATMTRLLATDTSPFFMTLKTEVSEDTSYNELVSLGTFLITQVDITETGGPTGGGTGGGGGGNGVTGTGGSSTGGGLSLVVSGIDLSYAISRNTWTSIFYVPANTNYATAMLEIAQNRLPGITSDVASTEVTAQRLLFGTSQGADAWQDVQDMGTAIGSRAYFDPLGTFKVKPIADPALTPSVWTVSDAANPVMVSYTRSISDSTTYNYVVVSGESTSNTVPVSAVAFDNDPSSPTYYLGPYNIVTTTFISAMITTTAQAQQAADALLLVVKGASETVQITMVPNPALEPDDVITVVRTYNGQKIIQGTFKINSISTPVGQAQAQVLVCYRQSAAQG